MGDTAHPVQSHPLRQDACPLPLTLLSWHLLIPQSQPEGQLLGDIHTDMLTLT